MTEVVAAGVVGLFPDRKVTEVAPPSSTKLSHVLLKWLHHLEADQNVTLLHCAEFWHDWEHAATSLTRPDPLFGYPLFVGSHALPEIVRVLPLASVVAAGVVGLFADWNVTEVPPLETMKSLHVVLKWLHHLEE